MNKKWTDIVQFILIASSVILLNVLGHYLYTWYDLTEENRYTLTEPTRDLLKKVDDVVSIKVLLKGDFPAGFKKLQRSTREMLDQFRTISGGMVEYTFQDPTEGSTEEVNERKKALSEDGITPVNLRMMEDDAYTEKLFYPYALIYYKNRMTPVNLLENPQGGGSPQQKINQSVNLLEYKVATAIKKVQETRQDKIVFTKGKGELPKDLTGDLESTLRSFYETGHMHWDSLYRIHPDIDMVIIPKPTRPFSEKERFMIDQYVMNGGKVLWMIDALRISLDSVSKHKQYVPLAYDLQLDELFFEYGFRINEDLVLDLECSSIPLQVGTAGGKPQYELFPWYYFPVASSKNNHPIVNNIGRVDLRFPSSVDTVGTKGNIRKTPLLTSSQNSRLQLTPVQVSFEILRYEPQTEKFDKEHIPMAYLLEGRFTSPYQNRLSAGMEAGLEQLGLEFKARSPENKMIVIADGDVAKNGIDPRSGKFRDLGFNAFERRTYSNKTFLLNAIEYLLDEEGLLEARSKEFKLRRLNTVKAKSEQIKWQLFNIALPLLFLVLIGFGFSWWRKRKYA